MSKTSTDTPIKALYFYCLLAIGITLIAVQDRVWSQSKVDSSRSLETDTKQEQTKQVSKEGSENKTLSTEKPDAKASEKTNTPDKSQSFPVVRVKTEAADGSESHLSFQSDAFDVVPPDWYQEPFSADKENVVRFFAFGFDDEQLKEDFESRLQSEIDRYVDQLLGPTANYYVRFSDLEKERIVTRKEVKPGIYFDGQKQNPVDFCFTHVEFTEPFQTLATNKWVEKRQQSRLIQYGLIGGALLLLIGFVFGGLRLNSATSGFYQGRLQFFVAIVILGVIAAGVYFGTIIDWL